MLKRTRRCFCGSSGKARCAALGNDDTVRSCALRTSDYGTEIVGILYSVKNNDEGHFAAILGDLQNILYRAIFLFSSLRGNALMNSAAAKLIELLLFYLDYRDAARRRLADDHVDRAFLITAANEDLIYRSTRFQKLSHLVSAVDYPLRGAIGKSVSIAFDRRAAIIFSIILLHIISL
jgi:hypothetical protein